MVTKTSHLPIRYLLSLLRAHPILHVSRIRVKGNLCLRQTLRCQHRKDGGYSDHEANIRYKSFIRMVTLR